MSMSLALALQVAAQSPRPSQQVSQTDLNAMADACHAPRDWLVLRDRQVIIQGGPDGDLTRMQCVLGKVSAVVPMSDIAFIGNEQASEEK